MVFSIPVSGNLQTQIQQEFCQSSAIAFGLFQQAIAVVADIEIDPLTHEVIGTPIADALGWHFTRFGQQARSSQTAAIFVQESNEVWQLKVFGGESGKRTGSYLAPKGVGNRAYLPPIDEKTQRELIGEYVQGLFWDWIAAHPEVPLVITEGGKKGLSGLSAGSVAIALYGCDCGNSPDLTRFLVPGRQVFIAFDQDEKATTRARVGRGIARLARRAIDLGCSVRIAQWDPALGKGIDDLIAAHGAERWHQILAAAPSFEDWQRRRIEGAIFQRLRFPLGKYQPSLQVSEPDLSQAIALDAIPETGIVALLSGKGTGKTKLLTKLVDGLKRVLAPGHRESLQRGLGRRLGLDYLHDTDRAEGRKLGNNGEPTYRLSLCWDSLLAIAPKDYPIGSYELVIDEADQGFRHLINGATCGKRGMRPALIDRAETLIRGARRVLLASADLTTLELDYVASLRNEQPWILQNDYREDGYCCQFLSDIPQQKGSRKRARAAALLQLIEAIHRGDRLWIAVDTLKASKALYQLAIALGVPAKRILRYDGETSSDPDQRQFADSPHPWIERYQPQIIIASPSLTSGVSIEIDYFDCVFGFFEGQSIAPWDVDQALSRVRQPVPRIVFAVSHGKSQSISAAQNALTYQADLYRRTELFASFSGMRSLMEQVDFHSPSARYHAASSAECNAAMAEFGLSLRLRLEVAGNSVFTGDAMEMPDLEPALELWNTAQQQVQAAADIAKLRAEAIDDDTAIALRQKRVLTLSDRLKLSRYDLCQFYGISPEKLTLEDIVNDANGRQRHYIKTVELLIWDRLAQHKDKQKLDKLIQWEKPIPAQDLPTAQLLTKAADILGVRELLVFLIQATKSDEGWTKDTPEITAFVERCLAHQREVKLCLNLTVRQTMEPTAIVGMVLKQFGLSTMMRRETDENQHRTRRYRLELSSLKRLKTLLQTRMKQYLEEGFQLRPHPLTSFLLVGVADNEPLSTPQQQILEAHPLNHTLNRLKEAS
ncbi:plasmid replication protein, CyRepA1 family (plasmid) [Synechococcus elongatus PCC 11801]|uniref:Plasmid replication protein, CyRepA1 family n=1 Tax=Synechococcus elongatus PCC 11801 TaxID=2219813 RepID=A0ACD5A2X5_SYNEL